MVEAFSEDNVRALLRRRKIIIIGGQARPENIRRLERQLRLCLVRHCPTRKKDASPRAYASWLEHDDALLAVVLKGATRTSHGRDARNRCKRLGIPFIECDKVPHPDALLHQIAELRLMDMLERRASYLKRRHGDAA